MFLRVGFRFLGSDGFWGVCVGIVGVFFGRGIRFFLGFLKGFGGF